MSHRISPCVICLATEWATGLHRGAQFKAGQVMSASNGGTIQDAKNCGRESLKDLLNRLDCKGILKPDQSACGFGIENPRKIFQALAVVKDFARFFARF